MVQILITVMAGAIILPLAYFQFKGTSLPKRMLIAGVIVAAALASSLLQSLDFALYVPLLAIVAISMIGALVYGKVDEMETQEKQRIAEKRRSKIPVASRTAEPQISNSESTKPDEPEHDNGEQASVETLPVQPFAMQSITPERKEH